MGTLRKPSPCSSLSEGLPLSIVANSLSRSNHTNSKWWQGLFPTIPPATYCFSCALPAPLLSDKLLFSCVEFPLFLISAISTGLNPVSINLLHIIWQGWKEVHSCDTLYLIDRRVVFFVPVVFLATKPIPFGVPFKHSSTLKNASGTCPSLFLINKTV